MKNIGKYPGKGLTLRKGILALFAVLALALLIAAACGEAATATPEAMPDEPTPMADEPTAMSRMMRCHGRPTAMADEEPDDRYACEPTPTAMTEETGMPG